MLIVIEKIFTEGDWLKLFKDKVNVYIRKSYIFVNHYFCYNPYGKGLNRIKLERAGQNKARSDSLYILGRQLCNGCTSQSHRTCLCLQPPAYAETGGNAIRLRGSMFYQNRKKFDY